jgi:hypothetical protein
VDYAFEMDLAAIIYISSFKKIDSGIQKLIRGIPIQKHRHAERKVIS